MEIRVSQVRGERINLKYRSYRQDKDIKSAGAIEKIKGEEVPEGFVLEVIHMSIANKTRGDTLLELGYETATGDDKILTTNIGTARYEWHLTGHAWIEAGEAPFGRVTTANEDDLIAFSCHGKLWPKS